jgi:DNA-binding transcriptional MerR regulator
MGLEEYSIGAIAKRTGYGPPTIRYFEDIGFLPRVERTAGGRRLYRAAHVERLVFIRNCRTHGLTQAEVRTLIELLDAPEQPCGEVTQILTMHLDKLKASMATLAALIDGLEAVVQSCDGSAVSRCRIVHSLATDKPRQAAPS